MGKDKETQDAIEVFYSKVDIPLNLNTGKPDKDKAATLAMNVSVKENPTYSEGIDHKKIRDYWRKMLIALLPKYQQAKPVRVSVFIRDIRKLKIKMNSHFPDSFINKGRAGDDCFDKEFRIAHAQKSLSIFLKHMWCITDNMPEPPVCPIDGRVLKIIRNNGTWTKLNNIATYKTYLKQVRAVARANNMSLAKWELITWNRPLEQVSKVSHNMQQATKKNDKPTNNLTPPLYKMKAKDGGHYVLEEEQLTYKGIPFSLILCCTSSGKSHFCGFWNKDVPNTNFDSVPEIQDIINKLSLSSLKWEPKPNYSRKYVMYTSNDSYKKAKELKDKISEFIHNMNK